MAVWLDVGWGFDTVSSQGPAAEGGKPRSTIGRRLFVALFSLAGAFALAVLFLVSGLRDIEAALESMKRVDEKAFILLGLEAALEQYGQDALRHPDQRPGAADFAFIRGKLLELERNIVERKASPEAFELLRDIEHRAADLERLHERRIAAPSGAELEALSARAASLVDDIDRRIDELEASRHHAAVALREKVSGLERSTLAWSLALLVGALAVTLAIALGIRRAGAHPRARLGEAARRLAGGDMGARVGLRSRDEFGVLAGQFDAMAESLVRHQKELVQAEKLASLGRLAAGVAHELNNPLSVMIGYLMIHRRKADGKLARDLWKVEREAQHCREIVAELLDLARPAGDFEAEPVDLRQLCDDVVTELHESGQAAGSQVSVEGHGRTLGSRSKLKQVVWNLVKNGAEAAGSGGRVRVWVDCSAEIVEIAVEDSGPGIPPEARSRLFEPFFTTKPRGTGLGLAVSRAIARAHGGDIAIRDAETGGAVLAMRLPRLEGRA